MSPTPETTTEPLDARPRRASERTCVGCRGKAHPSALIRLAVLPEAPHVVPDPKGSLGGRGLWIMPRWSCLQRAARKGGFARALKRSVSVDPEVLRDQIEQQLERRLQGLAQGARRSGHAKLGADAVEESLRSRRTQALWVAVDAARREPLEGAAARLGARFVVWGTRGQLGAWFGKDLLAVVALEDEGLADAITEVAGKLAGLREGEDVRTGGDDRPGGA